MSLSPKFDGFLSGLFAIPQKPRYPPPVYLAVRYNSVERKLETIGRSPEYYATVEEGHDANPEGYPIIFLSSNPSTEQTAALMRWTVSVGKSEEEANKLFKQVGDMLNGILNAIRSKFDAQNRQANEGRDRGHHSEGAAQDPPGSNSD